MGWEFRWLWLSFKRCCGFTCTETAPINPSVLEPAPDCPGLRSGIRGDTSPIEGRAVKFSDNMLYERSSNTPRRCAAPLSRGDFLRSYRENSPLERGAERSEAGCVSQPSSKQKAEHLTALPIEGRSFFISNQETLALSLPSHIGIKEITKPTKNAQNGPLLSF